MSETTSPCQGCISHSSSKLVQQSDGRFGVVATVGCQVVKLVQQYVKSVLAQVRLVSAGGSHESWGQRRHQLEGPAVVGYD